MTLSSQIEAIHDKVDQLTQMVQSISQLSKSSDDIDAKSRYTLDEAASFLKVSPATLTRRAKVGRFIILHDGSRRFVMGAEILRYAREGAKRKIGPRRRHLSRSTRK